MEWWKTARVWLLPTLIIVVSIAAAVVVNVATELKHNRLAWIGVIALGIVLAGLTALYERRRQVDPSPVLQHFEKRPDGTERTLVLYDKSTDLQSLAEDLIDRGREND